MNRKSILGIFLVILALSLTLGVVSAEEIVSDDASADTISVEEGTTVEEVPSDENANAAGEPLEAAALSDTGVSDVGVEVTPLYDFGNLTTWSVMVYNLGPDDAPDTTVFLGASDNLKYFDHQAFDGVFDPVMGIWHVGDMPAYSYTVLLLAMERIAPGPCYIEAVVDSASLDPNPSNNYDIAYMGLSASAAEETMPAAGNPIAVALMALLVVGVGGLKRRL